jgi:di/tricarboxylate transporter
VWIVLTLLVMAVVLFALEKFSVDLVALAILCLLVISGILTVEEAFAGMGHEVIIMLGAIFVIGTGLRETGVLDQLGQTLARRTVKRPNWVLSGMMMAVGSISAFMNNTTVTAMFLGPVIALARRLGISASRFLMPLAFASILGGTCTLIGTSTNIAVNGALKKMGMEGIGMFDITGIGLILLSVGLLYMMFVGVRFLPDLEAPEGTMEVSTRREYFSEVVILTGSPIIGQEVYASDFSAMEFQVLQIRRGGQQVEVTPHTRFQCGDIVLVVGKVQNLIRVKKIEGLDILEDQNLANAGVNTGEASIAEVVLTPRCALVGQSLRSSHFRRRSGLSALALMRGSETLNEHMGDVILEPGDMLLLQGPYENIQLLESDGSMVILTEHELAHPNTKKRGLFLVCAFVLAVILSSIGLLPSSIAFLIVALLALASRCLTLDMAYENIDWRLLILIGGMTSFGTAMAKSGADHFLANHIVDWLAPYGSITVLAGFSLLTVLLTQPMSNAAAALVVLPIALQTAKVLECNPRSFAIAVMLSASVSVLTPFEPSCILVYGPGRYRFRDFLWVGGGLTIVMLAIILTFVPIFWPLKL